MARIRLISNALLAELLERAHAAMEGTDLLMVSPLCLWGYQPAAPPLVRRPEPPHPIGPSGRSAGAASDQSTGVAAPG